MQTAGELLLDMHNTEAVPMLMASVCHPSLDLDTHRSHCRRFISTTVSQISDTPSGEKENALALLLWHAQHDYFSDIDCVFGGANKAKGPQTLFRKEDHILESQCESLVTSMRRHCIRLVCYLARNRHSFGYFTAPLPQLMPPTGWRFHSTAENASSSLVGSKRPCDAVRVLLEMSMHMLPSVTKRSNALVQVNYMIVCLS